MTIPQALGHEIRAEAEAQQIPLIDFTKKVGIGRGSLYRYLNAERDVPLSVLLRCADAFGMPASELLYRAEQRARFRVTDHGA